MKLTGALFLFSMFLMSCGKDIQTPFDRDKLKGPTANGPAATISDVSYCQADSHGNYAEAAVTIADNGTNSDGHAFAQGGGCVLRSITDVWAASRSSEAFHWNRSNVDSVTLKTDPDAVYFYEADYSAGPVFFTQHWVMGWYHTLQEGTTAAPQKILIQYQKTSGTSHIAFWQGAVTLESVTATVTSVAMRDEVQADQTGPTESAGSVTDLVGKLRTLAPQPVAD
jgi:hypothetical protein